MKGLEALIMNNVAIKRNFQEEQTELNAVECGADSSGETDVTELLIALHATGKRVYYPNGIYRFNGTTLDLSGGVRFETSDGVTIRNDKSALNVLRFDADGHLIGLMQNHLEAHEADGIMAKSGSLVSPPINAALPRTKVDILAYWYNDFGREAQIINCSGSKTWYSWSWNHHDCQERQVHSDPYDPARHPLLGFYYGDDPVVLDWQSYWLGKYGIGAVILLAGSLRGWETPSGFDYWIYQLMHNAPNFKLLRYLITASTRRSNDANRAEVSAEIREQWDSLLNKIYTQFDNYYTIIRNGKVYPVMSLWEERNLPLALDPDGGVENTERLYLETAQKFRQAGFNGVAFICRQPIPEFQTIQKSELFEQNGLIRIECTYLANYVSRESLSGGMTYPQVVDSFDPPDDSSAIIGVATAMHSHTPHPSKWVCPNHNPYDFYRWLKKAIDHIDRHPEMPRVVTCYNVAEWAEGGPGLQPNVQDGFGYLEAVAQANIL